MMNEDIKKVETEETEDFGTILENFEQGKKRQKIKEGLIVDMNEGTVFIDVGGKVEGVLPIDEIKDSEGNVIYQKGEKIPVIIRGKTKNDAPILTHKAALSEMKKREFLDNYKEGDIVKVKIKELNKGGFVATNDDGIEFFIPKSESALKLDEDNKGKVIEAKIIEVKRNGVVLSRKELLKEKKEKRAEFIEEIKDKVIPAKVKNFKRDGVVIELEGGWTGFVPKEEVSHKKVNHFAVLKRDQDVEVKLLDPDKMLFSIKATQPDPWQEVIDSELENGDEILVTVTNIREYGAFVDIGNGVEGFLHISEISWNSNEKIDNLLKVGDEIKVEVTDLDIENRRLRVSYKSLLPKPAEEFANKHKEGDLVEGKVVNTTEIGGFIDVDGIVCFLPNRFVSWVKGEKATDVLENGESYKFKVISIEPENNKIILSKKDAEDSPYVAFSKKYQLGDSVKGEIKNIADFGLFVSLDNGVEALVRKGDLEKEISEYEVGEEIEGKIIELDPETKRVKLSQK